MRDRFASCSYVKYLFICVKEILRIYSIYCTFGDVRIIVSDRIDETLIICL